MSIFSPTSMAAKANDITAEALSTVYWMDASDSTGTSWTSYEIADDLPKTRHGDARTMRAAHLVPSSTKPDFVVTPGGGDYLFQVHPISRRTAGRGQRYRLRRTQRPWRH